MDRRFLEFFGNFLLNAAQGQKQLEDIARLTKWDSGSSSEMTAQFRKFYGLGEPGEAPPDDSEPFEKAVEKFQASFRDWMELMGVVPAGEYSALKKKYRNLQEKLADQENTISRLKTILKEKGAPQNETIKGFAEMMETQASQFQELMENMGRAVTSGKDK